MSLQNRRYSLGYACAVPEMQQARAEVDISRAAVTAVYPRILDTQLDEAMAQEALRSIRTLKKVKNYVVHDVA